MASDVSICARTEPQAHPALQVFNFDTASYLVNSPSGRIMVPRVREQSNEPQPGPSRQAPQPLTNPSHDQRELQPKMRTSGNRAQSHPPNPAYPSSRVTRAKSVLEMREDALEQANRAQAEKSEKSKSKSTSHPRGPNGKFLPKK